MDASQVLHLLAKAEYPGPWITGPATLALLAFIFGGGYWFKHAEAKGREEERAYALQLAEERSRQQAASGTPSAGPS